MNHPQSALRHLWAAVQLLQSNQFNQLGRSVESFLALRNTIMKLDFLAQSIVPYSQSSLIHISNQGNLHCGWAGMNTKESTGRSVFADRDALVQLISEYNFIDKVIWGPWYSTTSRPSLNILMQFQSELQQWSIDSTATFGNCSERILSDPFAGLEGQPASSFPIPPEPLHFNSTEAAINVALFNNYMACTMSMLACSTGLSRYESDVFRPVYQNLRIAAGLYPDNATLVTSAVPREAFDVSLSLLLYLGFRRCYSTSWQNWTICKLRQCGRQGLLDGHAFANALENLGNLQLRANIRSAATKSAPEPHGLLGSLQSRIIPLLLPRGEDGRLSAFYLQPEGGHFAGQHDIALQVIAKAIWEQDDVGCMINVKFDFYDCPGKSDTNHFARHDLQSASSTPPYIIDPVDEHFPCRHSVELGWHSFFT